MHLGNIKPLTVDPPLTRIAQNNILTMSTESDSTGMPSAKPVEIKPNVIIQPPLSRCGQGPALILIRPSHYSDYQKNNTSLDPEPLLKWAEESFTVAQVTLDASTESASTFVDSFQAAKGGLTGLPARTGKHQYGLISELLRPADSSTI